MNAIQECFNCAKVGACAQTSTGLILRSFVCPLFALVDGTVVLARETMLNMYGPVAAARSLLRRPNDPSNEEQLEMSTVPPPPGTTYSERKKQLEVMPFMDVRILGIHTYKDQNRNPILSASESLAINQREVSIQKILDFEAANNFIVPDQNAAQQGAEQMTQPFQPPMPPGVPMPGQQAPAQPMPTPQMPAPPFGMAPMPQPGMPPTFQPQQAPPQQMPPPPMPMAAPPAPPAQAAQAADGQAPAPTGKRKRGAAAAPPPPAPPAPPVPQSPSQFPPPMMQMPTSFQAPQMGPPAPQPMQFAPPQMQAPVPPASNGVAGVDFGPVLQLVDQVGKGMNAMGAAEQESLKQITSLLSEVKELLKVQLAALHHIYMTNSQLQQSVAGKDVGDAKKFIEYMKPYIP